MNTIKQIKECMKSIPFFMGCYNAYYQLRFGRRIKKRNQYFLQENGPLFHKFTQLLNDNGIVFWLEFGTLLGYFREHDFIKHDFDLDIGAHLSDAKTIRKILTENGFTLIRDFSAKDGGKEETYRYLHTTIDLFYFRIDEDNPSIQYCYTFKAPVFPIKRKQLNKTLTMTVRRKEAPNNGFEKTIFKDCNVYIPQKTDEYLTYHYGEDFMTPNPNFNPENYLVHTTYYSHDEMSGTGVYYELPL